MSKSKFSLYWREEKRFRYFLHWLINIYRSLFFRFVRHRTLKHWNVKHVLNYDDAEGDYHSRANPKSSIWLVLSSIALERG